METVAQRIADAPIDVREPKKQNGKQRTEQEQKQETGDNWNAPDFSILNAGQQKPPELPLEVFGEFWGQWIAEHSENRSVPTDYIACGLLAFASAVLGNTRWVSPWAGWSEPPIIWVGVVGDPSSGKSPALDVSLDLCRLLESDMAEDFPETLREWETQSETAKAVRDKWQGEVKDAIKKGAAAPTMPIAATLPDEPTRPRIQVSDPTPEALGKLLATHARGLLFHRDELAGWIGNFDRYGGSGGDKAFWAEAYGGRPYIIDRVKHKEPIRIPRLSVAIVGGIQPDRLRPITNGDDDGLAARFLFTWPIPLPPKRPRNVVDGRPALAALRRLHSIRMAEDDQGCPCPLNVRLSDSAADLFSEWRTANHRNSADASGMYASHLGKLPGLTLRLAIILEYLKWSEIERTEPETISIETVGYAGHLIDEYFKPMALRVYGDAALPDAERHAAIIARRIIKNRLVSVNAREIRRSWKISGLTVAKKVADALEVLTDADILRPSPSRQGTTPGRTKADFEANPQLWDGAGNE